jgi:hypothetical protein
VPISTSAISSSEPPIINIAHDRHPAKRRHYFTQKFETLATHIGLQE